MRLAERFRPQHPITPTTKQHAKKRAKQIAANYAVLKAAKAKAN